ncbi:hypothetical protein [Bifidobacterium avesanii]|uniref:Uncharacterized protein n=1 Tax=Bifidobacterium avesanii TaxID=1798157 RepID=A0A7K3TL22_9BIFI|nr:hypothetical protein [Bifidobacterium avesanii]NEG78973.1 hypothetical protein [Bifidobacterium avesanii]
MKSNIKHNIKLYLIAFIILIASFSALLVVTFLIPQSAIENNRINSINFLKKEGNYPNPLYGNTKLDNFTDKLMLEQVGPENASIYRAFTLYTRYWNGWAVLLRPLLLIGNITVIRGLLSAIFWILLILSIYLIARRTNIFYGILFFSAMLPARLDLVAVSMQFTHVYFALFIFLIWLLYKEHKIDNVILGFFCHRINC